MASLGVCSTSHRTAAGLTPGPWRSPSRLPRDEGIELRSPWCPRAGAGSKRAERADACLAVRRFGGVLEGLFEPSSFQGLAEDDPRFVRCLCWLPARHHLVVFCWRGAVSAAAEQRAHTCREPPSQQVSRHAGSALSTPTGASTWRSSSPTRGHAETVDQLGLERRRTVPFASTWEGASIAEHGPIPTDVHFFPPTWSSWARAAQCQVPEGTEGSVSSSGKPWASYSVAACDLRHATVEPPPPPHKPKQDEEMWRAQYQSGHCGKSQPRHCCCAAQRAQAGVAADGRCHNRGKPARTSKRQGGALALGHHWTAHAHIKSKLTEAYLRRRVGRDCITRHGGGA